MAMEDFSTDYYELSFPENWVYWQDEDDEDIFNFCQDVDDPIGIFQISCMSSDASFDIVNQQEDFPRSQNIHLNEYEALYFEELDGKEKAYNWITGNEGVLLYFTYIVERDSDHEEELKIVNSILDTLTIF